MLVSVGAVCKHLSNYFILLTGLKWAETNLTTQSVMVTGLAFGKYRHMDLVDEVWPYFVEKDISRVYYSVVILPLQRRVRTHTHKLCLDVMQVIMIIMSLPPVRHSFSVLPPFHPLMSPPISPSLLLPPLPLFFSFLLPSHLLLLSPPHFFFSSSLVFRPSSTLTTL